MRSLLVEDNPQKRRDLSDFYRNGFPSDELKIESSLISGLRIARDFRPEFIMLDMTLPNYPPEDVSGGHSELLAFAGREFIMRVNRMGFQTSIVVVSMFETFGPAPTLITLESLHADLKQRYSRVYMGAVHYSPSMVDWQIEIAKYRDSAEKIL